VEANKIVLSKHGKVIIEIPMSEFPIDVSGLFLNPEMVWKVRNFTWKLSYHKDRETYQKKLDSPKGSQLE
jgi:hypothetical protein